MVPIALAYAGYVGLAYVAQEKLIYMPRTYSQYRSYYEGQRMRTDKTLKQLQGSSILDLPYTIGDGKLQQTAYFIPPREAAEDTPMRLWVLTGGNAALALDWLHFVSEFLHSRHAQREPAPAFLLLDYPG